MTSQQSRFEPYRKSLVVNQECGGRRRTREETTKAEPMERNHRENLGQSEY